MKSPGVAWTILGLLAIASVAAGQEYAGSRACAECHRQIYDSYRATAMARTSGIVESGSVSPGEVRHGASGATYRIQSGEIMRYSVGPIQGARKMAYFIGSSAAARSFLWREDDAMFELPVTWYAKGGWAMSPGYESGQTLQLARPIEPECLLCHVSRVKTRVGSINRYDWPPASEPGIGCERCHGGGAAHIAHGGRGYIVNPAKLTQPHRDHVCAQCHLTGVERVALAGRDLSSFQPGADLNDYVTVFLWSGAGANAVHVASHFERLAASKCRNQTGGTLSCGNCHDSHAAPARAQRAAYFRGKCMVCHESNAHAREKGECRSCHMPAVPASDAKGTAFTDHLIQRNSGSHEGGVKGELRAFGKEAAPREAGIAWARVAHRSQKREDGERALAFLRQAYANGARDAATLTALAYLTDQSGDEQAALSIYEQAVEPEDRQAEALVNLGAIYVEKGRLLEAEKAWVQATRRNPGLEAGWIKLAALYLATMRDKGAASAAASCLRYHPDSAAAIEVLESVKARTANALP